MDDAGDGAPPQHPRLIAAGVLATGLLAAVAVVVVSGGGEDSNVEPELACLEAWNSDPAARTYGVHNFDSHGYQDVHVLRLDTDGQPASPGEGSCAVVFASATLDPEPIAAAQVYSGDSWRPLSELPSVSAQRLGELQSDAVGDANATLDDAGALTSKG